MTYLFSKPMKITLFLSFASLFLVQCASTYRAQNIQANVDAQQVRIDPSIRMEDNTDRMTIKSAEQNGDILILDVSYSGGCADHEFELVSNGNYKATYPPELQIKLLHNSNGDGCRGMIDKKLYFNIQPFQYAGTTQVLLVLKNTNKTLDYNY